MLFPMPAGGRRSSLSNPAVSLAFTLAPGAHCSPFSVHTHQVLVNPSRIILRMGMSCTDNAPFQKLEILLSLCRLFQFRSSLQHLPGSSSHLPHPGWIPASFEQLCSLVLWAAGQYPPPDDSKLDCGYGTQNPNC